MITYHAEWASKAISEASEDIRWSEQERLCLKKISGWVDINEQRLDLINDERRFAELNKKYPDFVSLDEFEKYQYPPDIQRRKWLDTSWIYTVYLEGKMYKFTVEQVPGGYNIGKNYPEPDITSILTTAEAAKLWNLETSTVKKACQQGRFTESEARKSGGTWLVSIDGMERLYGPKTKE